MKWGQSGGGGGALSRVVYVWVCMCTVLLCERIQMSSIHTAPDM